MSKRIVQQIVDVRVPQTPKQIVEVILTAIAFFFFFDSVWEGGCGRHVPHVLLRSPHPHARVDSECKRWNLEHVVLDLFSHFTVVQVRWSFVSCRGSNSTFRPFASCEPHSCRRSQASFRLSVLTWQDVHRRVLRELDIEFDPTTHWTSSFFTACSYHGSSRRLAPATGRVRLTLPERATSCSCASSTCAIASESGRIACGTWTRQLCAWFHQASVGGPRRAESAHVFASRAFVTVTHGANMRGGMWTQIVHEGKTDRAHPHGQLFLRQLVTHSPTHWIPQDALLDMIDAVDDARTSW